MKRALAVLAIASLVGAPAAAAGKPKPEAAPPSLRMEDLEVRGARDRPEPLYAPVYRTTDRPSPVRYDLFLIDNTTRRSVP